MNAARGRRRGLNAGVHVKEKNWESLLIGDLSRAYRNGSVRPAEVVDRLLERAIEAPSLNIWITRLPRAQVMSYVEKLAARSIEDMPLYGIPFVVKDNIDLAGVATTAGCAEFAYTPPRSARVVEKLLEAGAIPLGKVNMDQFATGLVGTRSPYGACGNSFDAAFISGGSSSGSAVAVATGLASFALGTDTAGSGRVPAAFNNIIGLKPSHGRLSTRGVVPACRSLDCVSIFALTTEDAAAVLEVAEGYDPDDAYSRPTRNRALGGLRFGVPRENQLEFCGDVAYQEAFAASVERLSALGGTAVEIDFEPFLKAARLLYEGPWIAERYAAVGHFIEANPPAVFPVTRQIIDAGRLPSAAAAFSGQYELMNLKRASEHAWSVVDMLLTPTTATIYSIAAVAADPIRLNSTLGYYTNFVNFFDLAAVAVPAGFRPDGMPFGITLVGPNSTDRDLLNVSDKLHRSAVHTLGASAHALPAPAALARAPSPGYLAIAVCGAHMDGLPLNHQLRNAGGYLLRSTRTAAVYRLLALPGGPPQRPGLVRVASGGAAIALEVWALPAESVGPFVAQIPAPLGVGSVELEDGAVALGFLCEAYAAEGATDISVHGGWRSYLKA
jgi:allophanate hydrolase